MQLVWLSCMYNYYDIKIVQQTSQLPTLQYFKSKLNNIS